VQEHALRVDVADFQVEGFAQTQAAGVDGGEGDAVIEGGDGGQDPADLGGGRFGGLVEVLGQVANTGQVAGLGARLEGQQAQVGGEAD
jgi:hypothetical protein